MARDPLNCRRGHPKTPENTYVSPKGSRCCRVCKAEAQVGYQPAYRAAQREVREAFSETTAQPAGETGSASPIHS